MPTVTLPSPMAVRLALESAVGLSVSIQPSVPLAPREDGPVTVAVYVDRFLRTLAVVGLDIRLAALAGAAHSLVPAGVAREAAGVRQLPDLLDNSLRVVGESLSALFGGPDVADPHLYDIYPPGATVPHDAAAYLMSVRRRMDMIVSITGYGEGRLSLVLVP
ncbi:MAG: hypothetical protein ACYCXA_06295 [Actinomycetes bacterium]